MKRVAVIVSSCLVFLGCAVVLACHVWGEHAAKEGRRLHQHRVNLGKKLEVTVDGRSVVFMGDSTMLDKRNWTVLVGPGLRRHGITPINVSYPGQDLFQHYCISGEVLEWKPDLVIILVNPRATSPGRRRGRSMNLCSFLPPPQVMRSMDLPFYDRDVSLVRLWLLQALRNNQVLDAFFAFEGARRLIADSRFGIGAATGGKRTPTRRRALGVDYENPLWPAHPLVEVLGALVHELRDHGVHPMVVVAPVPPVWLDAITQRNPEHWKHNHDVLKLAVEEAGGELIDLHDFMPASSFLDLGGHLNGEGHARMFNRLAFRIHELLDLPPPTPVARP